MLICVIINSVLYDTGMDHWYVTVVAINNAMTLSEPVCSDGVCVDTTATVVKEVLIRGANVKQGIGCYNESQWIVWSNRTKQLLPEGKRSIAQPHHLHSRLY